MPVYRCEHMRLKQNKNLCIKGTGIFLRPVRVSDARREYVRWLNDKEVNQFLESRFFRHTFLNLRAYIKKTLKDKDTVFLVIVRSADNKHIGNIKLGPINWHHKFGEVGIMIGDKASWGKGYATEAITLVEQYATKVLRLHKLTAGVYEENIGSYRAFTKCGFLEEGRLAKHYCSNGKYIDGILLAKLI